MEWNSLSEEIELNLPIDQFDDENYISIETLFRTIINEKIATDIEIVEWATGENDHSHVQHKVSDKIKEHPTLFN